MTKLRAGLIGLGMMGRHHARVLGSLESVELVAVADAAGDRHGAANNLTVEKSLKDLLRHTLDYCVVAVPTAMHQEIGLELAARGIHMLVEKPLANGPVESERLVDAFRDHGLVGAVGHIERYNPALQEARRRIEQGELGKVTQVATRRQGPFPARIADVGVIKDLATHDIDLTAWVTQRSYESVSAHTAIRSGRDYEDLVAAVGRLTDGTVTSHLVNWLSPFKERVTVITGEKGAFTVNTLTADLTFHANGTVETLWDELAQFRGVSEGDMVRYAFKKPEPLRTEHEAFRDAVLERPADIVTLEQGLATVEVAEAMIASGENDGVATIPHRRRGSWQAPPVEAAG